MFYSHINKDNLKKNTVLALSTLMLFPLVSLGSLSSVNAQKNESISEPQEVENISDNIEIMLGKEVTVRGSLDKNISEQAFTLKNAPFPQELVDEDKILVFDASDTSIPQLPEEDDKLQVRGIVGKFVLADVEKTYGLDLDDELYVDYENKPVIFANTIALAPEPREITGEPEYYYNKSVAVKGEVAKIIGKNTFTISRGEVAEALNDVTGRDELLVLNLTKKQIPTEDTDIIVTGVVRSFTVTELEKEYDLNWDLELKEKLVREYLKKPILIVDSIYSLAE